MHFTNDGVGGLERLLRFGKRMVVVVVPLAFAGAAYAAATNPPVYVEINSNGQTIVAPLNKPRKGRSFRDHIEQTPTSSYGIDFYAGPDTAITATASGRIDFAGTEVTKGGYEVQSVVINHGFGYKSWLCCLNNLQVKYGDKVDRGRVLGFEAPTPRFLASGEPDPNAKLKAYHLHITLAVPGFMDSSKSGLEVIEQRHTFGKRVADPDKFGLDEYWDGSEAYDEEFKEQVNELKEEILGLAKSLPYRGLRKKIKEHIDNDKPHKAVKKLEKALTQPRFDFSDVQKNTINGILDQANKIRPYLTLPHISPDKPELYGATIQQ